MTLKIYTIKDKIRSLTNLELKHFIDFQIQQQKFSNQLIINIYRGLSLDFLCKNLGVDSNKPNYKKLLEKLFMIGEKSKYFKYKNSEFNLSDSSKTMFENIFDWISSSLSMADKLEIQKFCKQNIFFVSFFSNTRNRIKFINTIANLNENIKISIRNYYLILLHQFDNNPYKVRSLHTSTTIDTNVSSYFATNDGVIIHAWIPRKEIQNYTHIIKQNNLPLYISPFVYEKELSILPGIFPHYMIGLEIIEGKKFYVNPYLFTNYNINKHTFLNGLNIDQSRFFDYLKDTSYKKFVLKYKNNIFQERVLE